MGVSILVRSAKFYSEFINDVGFGSLPLEFTNNLAGSVMENLKLVQEIDIEWDSVASLSNTWFQTPTTITSQANSFINDGFAVGDTADFISGYAADPSTPVVANITIDSISADGKTLVYTLNSGSFPLANDTWNDAGLRGLTDLTSSVYKFGLVDNNANFSITSLVSNNDQGYYGSGIGERVLGVRDTNFVELQRLGSYEDWRTGSARIKYDSNPSTYVQRFIVEHEFTIVPYYLDGQLENLQDNVIPDLLAGLNSLKYVYSPGFRTVLSNPNTEKVTTLENNLGSVAWFNENFNGFNNNYQVNSVVYEDAITTDSADGILIGSKTKVTIQVEKNSGNFSPTEKAGVYVSYLPSQDEYEDTTLTDLKANFLYDNAINVGGIAPVVNGKDFIEDLVVTNIVGNTMTLIFEVEYSSLQKAFLSNKNAQDPIYFIIGVQLGDSEFAGNSDKVTILADVKEYDESADIPDLIVNPSFNLFPYREEVGVDAGFSSITQWNEDGFTMEGSFDLDLNKDAVLNTLEFRLIAENSITGSFFELDSFVFNVANPIVVSGVQQFNLITDRGYNLENGSQFNDVSLTTGGLAAGLQTYNLRFSQKISWQDWIANNLVDSIFYDNTKPNDNLNNKASNYSNLNGYNIKLSMFSNLTGTSDLGVSGITDYHILTPSLTVYDYDVSAVWTATIETFNPNNLTDLSGAILTGQNTLFKITWVNSGGAVTDLTDFTARHRIEGAFQNGYDIDEIGTLYSYPTNNRVIPKGGFTNLDMYLDSGNVITECLINGSQLVSGIGYNISGRIDVESTVDPNAKATSPDGLVKDTSGTVETKVIA